MSIFTTFSFDIIIILVLGLSFLTGMYLSLYRQIGFTLALGIPLVLLYFLFDYFMNAYTLMTGMILFKRSPHRYLFNALFAYGLAFIILAILTYFVYRLFRPSVQKRVLNQASRLGRSLGGVLGLVSGYLICTFLIYTIKPFVNYDTNHPLTRVILATENKVNTISKLNQYQNINVEKHKKYQECIDLFTGRRALDFYSEIEELIILLPEKNISFETEIYQVLNDDSQSLLEKNFENDYMETLVKKEGSKPVYRLILENEKENQNYSLIESSFAFLIENENLILLYYKYIQNNLPELNFTEIIKVISENEDKIINEIPKIDKKTEFKKGLDACYYYQDNSDKFISYLDYEIKASDLSLYVSCFETLLKSEVFPDYLEKFFLDDDFFELKEVFQDYLKYQDQSLIESNFSIATIIVLGEEKKNWFEKPLWEENELLRAYILDALASSDNYGSKLYSEYFFIKYLTEPEEYLSFGLDEFENCLFKLESLVELDLINDEVAEQYIWNLLRDDDSILLDLIKKEITPPTIFEDIVGIENKYLTDALKAEILKG